MTAIIPNTGVRPTTDNQQKRLDETIDIVQTSTLGGTVDIPVDILKRLSDGFVSKDDPAKVMEFVELHRMTDWQKFANTSSLSLLMVFSNDSTPPAYTEERRTEFNTNKLLNVVRIFIM